MTGVRERLAVWLLRGAHWLAGRHVYVSTSCHHGKHQYCQAVTGTNGDTVWAKNPARCKFCPAPCLCSCHQTESVNAPGAEPHTAH